MPPLLALRLRAFVGWGYDVADDGGIVAASMGSQRAEADKGKFSPV